MVIKLEFDPTDLRAAHLRAARALLGMSATELASRTNLGLSTIKRAEATVGKLALTRANADRLVQVLEAAGVVLIGTNGGGPGARLREPEG